jgi:ankyrin repeat protein
LAACAFAETSDRDEAQYNKEFYTACATGDLQLLQKFLDEDPGLATTPTPDGETCLHLTSISKSVEIVKLMIDLGSDVNHRVTHSRVR